MPVNELKGLMVEFVYTDCKTNITERNKKGGEGGERERVFVQKAILCNLLGFGGRMNLSCELNFLLYATACEINIHVLS